MTKNNHNSKNNNRKNLIFFSIQEILDLSCIFDHFKKKSKVVKFTWKIWNQLNRKKNQISDFSDYYFSSYAEKTVKQAILWMPLSAYLFRLKSSIQKHAGSRGCSPGGGAGGQNPPKLKIFQHFSKFQFFFLKRSRIGRIESKTKFMIFIFRVMVIFALKITKIFNQFSPIARKIKIGEFFHYFSHAIQHTPHHSWKPDQNWGGGSAYP